MRERQIDGKKDRKLKDWEKKDNSVDSKKILRENIICVRTRQRDRQ